MLQINIITPKEDVIALFLFSTSDSSGSFWAYTWHVLNSELVTSGGTAIVSEINSDCRQCQ
jgi:hypothetical protein